MVAGVKREHFWSFLLIATQAKATRYLALAASTLGGLRHDANLDLILYR